MRIEESTQWKSLWEEVSVRDDGELFVTKINTTKKKKKKKINKPVPELPNEITFNILTRIPVELLHKKFRYVCKQWNSIISSPFFIDQSIRCSKKSLIVQDLLSYKSSILEIKDKGHELARNPYPQYYKVRRRFRSSCNGLLLVSYPRPRQPGELEVMNPVMKGEIKLPLCPSSCPHQTCGCGIAFSASTGEYKVVHIYADLFGFEIFTLGCLDNTWRRLPGPFKDQYDKPFGLNFWWDDPVLVNESILHWNVDSHEYIISMDITDEKLRKTSLPNDKLMYESMTEMGGFLCVFYVSKIGIDIWILQDFEKQEWKKQHSIVPGYVRYLNSSARMPRLNKLLPVHVDGRVILFMHKTWGSNSGLYTYDMESGTLRRFKMKAKNKHIVIPHVNTLNDRLKALVLEAKPNFINPAGMNLEATGAVPGFESMAQREDSSNCELHGGENEGGFLTDSDLEKEFGEDEDATPNAESPMDEDFMMLNSIIC